MIKRHFLIIVLLAFVGLQAFAEQIDEQQAVKIAVAFMNQKVEKNPSFRRGIKMKDGEMTVSHVIRSLKGEADIYILNARKKGNGFVIVAGDTHTGDAVLGYSDTGEFDYANAPENAKAWVDGYAKAVESLRLQGNAGKRKMPKAYASDIIDPLLTTQWGQLDPFNDLCPNSCPTGCVATAMAQIMKYWKWPEQGQGCHANFYEPSQTVDFSQSHYDWDAMLDNYNGVSDISDGSKTAVAKLMYDCGCSVDMEYYGSGSASSNWTASKALFWYFKYRKSTEVFRDGYEGDWEELLLNELREQRPILYSGGNGSAGHSFVCDGYAGDGCFHFNFGWDGNSDGNYRLDGELLYDQSQSVIVGICPDYEMTTTIVNDCLYQKIDENNARLEVYYAKSKETAIIPESVEIDGKNYAVTEIAEYAFWNCTALTSITIGNSVATIGEYAFWGCTGLKSITIPNSVKTIGDCAFYGCI